MSDCKNNEMQISDVQMKKIHECCQEILDVFVKICEKNHLRYYLIAGTLLGAIRHMGPIPWDDDTDVCMPRKDFERFKQIMLGQPDGEMYYIHCFENDPGSPRATVKFRKKGTVLATQFDTDIESRFMGVWIDIFPLDDSRGNSYTRMRLIGWIITRMKIILNTKALKTTDHMTFKRKCVHAIIKPIPMKLLYGFRERLMERENNKGYSYYVSWGSKYSYKKQTMPKDWYGEPMKVLYSGKYYDAPQKWDNILKQLYGDYMKLPKEEERGGHTPIEIKV